MNDTPTGATMNDATAYSDNDMPCDLPAVQEMYEVAKVVDCLAACYRAGRTPSEELLNRIDRAYKVLTRYENSRGVL